MSKVRANFIGGVLDDLLESSSSSRLSSPDLADLPEVAGGDYAVVVLDPFSQGGPPEIIHVQSHTQDATTASRLLRGREGTTARDHQAGTTWVQPWVVSDLTDLESEVTSATDIVTNFAAGIGWPVIQARGDLLVGVANDTVARLPIGDPGLTVIADPVYPSGVRWGQIDTAGLADKAVTQGKLGALTQGALWVGGAGNRPAPVSFGAERWVPVGDGTDVRPVLLSGDLSLASSGDMRFVPSALRKGIAGGAGAQVAADPDNVTIDFNPSDKLRVKPGSIGTEQLSPIPWSDVSAQVEVGLTPENAESPRTVANLGNAEVKCLARVVRGGLEIDYRFRWGTTTEFIATVPNPGKALDFSLPTGWDFAPAAGSFLQRVSVGKCYMTANTESEFWFAMVWADLGSSLLVPRFMDNSARVYQLLSRVITKSFSRTMQFGAGDFLSLRARFPAVEV